MIELRQDLMEALPDGAFDRMLNAPGKVHRQVANRRTVEFELGGRRYFVKAQFGCGWGEIIKNLLYGRLPIVSARTEWEALDALHAAGVPTLQVAGRGIRGLNPARLESFVVTDAVEGTISLEELAALLPSLPTKTRPLLKRALLREVAEVARKLHEAGMNHRDFYLCHFLTRNRDWRDWTSRDRIELVLIDLHRMQRRDRVPHRWLIKDLGGLLFSALDAGLTRNDLLRFIELYTGRPWREALASDKDLWTSVWRNAVGLYCGFHRREPPLRL